MVIMVIMVSHGDNGDNCDNGEDGDKGEGGSFETERQQRRCDWTLTGEHSAVNHKNVMGLLDLVSAGMRTGILAQFSYPG